MPNCMPLKRCLESWLVRFFGKDAIRQQQHDRGPALWLRLIAEKLKPLAIDSRDGCKGVGGLAFLRN